MPNFCAVIGCGSRGDRDRNSFFRIPCIPKTGRAETIAIKTKRRLKWIAALRRSDLTESKLRYALICDRHFVSGKPARINDVNSPDWVPNQIMGYNTKMVKNIANKVPTNQPHSKTIVNQSLYLSQTLSSDAEMVMKKGKSSKKIYNSVARKKVRNVKKKIDNALVSSTSSTFDKKEKQLETYAEVLLKLGNSKERKVIDEVLTSDEAEDYTENASFHQPCDIEDIFGQYVASEMRTLKDDHVLYLQTKQSILETLTSANFELLDSE